MAIERILVTGHLGFIASAFCEAYAGTYEIVGVDFGGWGSMEKNLMEGVADFRADIADGQRMEEILDETRPEAILNFAAESHVDRSNEDDRSFWRSNVMGTRILALQARQRGLRMVQVSTDEVYGDAKNTERAWTETDKMQPKNPYSVTKAAAEMLLRVYAEGGKESLNVVITRGANTIGPRQFPEKAVPKAIWCFTHDRPFPLFRTPARRMWMHVRDHVDGIEAALREGKRGEVYNLAPGAASEEITEKVIQKVRELVGRGEIQKVDDRPNYDLRYWMDASKAKKELSWEAQRDLKETLQDTAEWYLANMDWLEEAWKSIPG